MIDMAKYMENQRQNILLIINGIELKVNINQLLKLNKILLKLNENDLEMLKLNKKMLRINTELLKLNIASGADNFHASCDSDGQNHGENPSRVGGKGGVTVTDVTGNNKVSNNYKVSNENVFLDKKDPGYWERIKELFQPYWIAYPKEGRVKYDAAKAYFAKRIGEMPDPWFFLGVLNYYVYDVWGDGKPTIDQFIYNGSYKGLKPFLTARIERSRQELEKALQNKITAFNEGKDV